jgi:hypothetical protein
VSFRCVLPLLLTAIWIFPDQVDSRNSAKIDCEWIGREQADIDYFAKRVSLKLHHSEECLSLNSCVSKTSKRSEDYTLYVGVPNFEDFDMEKSNPVLKFFLDLQEVTSLRAVPGRLTTVEFVFVNFVDQEEAMRDLEGFISEQVAMPGLAFADERAELFRTWMSGDNTCAGVSGQYSDGNVRDISIWVNSDATTEEFFGCVVHHTLRMMGVRKLDSSPDWVERHPSGGMRDYLSDIDLLSILVLYDPSMNSKQNIDETITKVRAVLATNCKE